jgi:hypothetical protein
MLILMDSKSGGNQNSVSGYFLSRHEPVLFDLCRAKVYQIIDLKHSVSLKIVDRVLFSTGDRVGTLFDILLSDIRLW